MRVFLALLGRELRALVHSPIAGVVFTLFLALTGLNFYLILTAFARSQTPITMVEAFFNTTIFWYSFLAIFPLLTMRLYAEEFRQGTFEMLQTAPVRDWQIVLSKFLGAYVFAVALWLPTILYFTIYAWITREQAAPALGSYWGSYLLIALMAAFFVSIGCFASALTRNQIVAAIVSYVLIAFVFYIGLLGFTMTNLAPHLRALVNYLSSAEHMYEFNRGLLNTKPVVFYLSLAFLLQFLTHAVLQARRWLR